MKKQLLIIALLITSVATNAQLANMDFENWSPSGDFVAHPDNWVINEGVGQFGIFRDLQPQQGNYAMTLSRWYYYTFDDAVQHSAVSFKPAELSGFYRYTDNWIQLGEEPYRDTAHVYVYATKWNNQTQQRDTLGTGHLNINAADQWTSFVCPVYYTDGEMPDSVTIRLAPTERNLDGGTGLCANKSSGWCSYFTVDNLSLSPIVTDIDDKPAERFKLYPNPATNELFLSTTGNIQTYGYFIYDATGKMVTSGNLGDQDRRIDISGLPGGLYTINLFECYQMTTLKFIKQ